MPFSTGDVGGCGCGACTQTFTVTGCNSLPYPGVTVTVLTTPGGVSLASGTTDSTGKVTLSWAGSTGSYRVTVTGQSTRFAASSQVLTLTCGGTKTIPLTPTASFICYAGCLLPISIVLHADDGTAIHTGNWAAGLLLWNFSGFGTLDTAGHWSTTLGGCSNVAGLGITTSLVSCPPSLMVHVPASVPPGTCPTDYTVTE